jgi:hypothetical protein
MKRLQTARNVAQVFAVGSTTTLFEMEKGFLTEQILVSKWILLFLFVAAAIFFLGLLFDRIIEWSRLLRYCILARRDIEGHWVDVTLDRDTGEFINIAFTTITFRHGYFRSDGLAWYADRKANVCWETQQSDYSRDILTYRYETWLSGDPLERKHGAGVLTFHGDGKRLESYTGEFIDIYHLRRCANFGERIERGLFRLRRLNATQKRGIAEEHCRRRIAGLQEELGFSPAPLADVIPGPVA